MFAPSVSIRTRSKPSNIPKPSSPKYTTRFPKLAYQSSGVILAHTERARIPFVQPPYALPPLARPSTTSKVVVDVEDADHHLIAGTSKLPSESKAPANSADLLAAAVYLRPAWGIRSESSCDRGRFWSGFSCGGVQCRRIVKEYEHGLQRDGLVG